jgi:sec-independent protein translocase protein TatA
MLNIGPAELIVVLLVALLVVGPKRLPELGRTIGKGLREFRRATDDIRYSFEADLDDEEFRGADGDVGAAAADGHKGAASGDPSSEETA